MKRTSKRVKKMRMVDFAPATAIIVMMTNIRLAGLELPFYVVAKWEAAFAGKLLPFIGISILEWVVPMFVMFVTYKMVTSKAGQKAFLAAFYLAAKACGRIGKLIEKADAFCNG